VNQKRTQLSVISVAALAIVALIAGALFSTGGNAGTESATTALSPYGDSGGGGPAAVQPQRWGTPTPTPTPEPPCPPNLIRTALDEVSSGHYGIFHVCWDDRKDALITNPRPPAVVHGSEGATRYPARIDIATTDIHITSTAVRTLVRPNDPNAGQPGYIEAISLLRFGSRQSANPQPSRRILQPSQSHWPPPAISASTSWHESHKIIVGYPTQRKTTARTVSFS